MNDTTFRRIEQLTLENEAYHQENDKFREIIETCGKKFREYEEIHQYKMNKYSDPSKNFDQDELKKLAEKVESNRKLAEMCERSIK